MRSLHIIALIIFSLPICGQVVLDANGPGNTYELITAVLAPGHDPIEAPDCSHTSFGRHIDEVFDTTLNTHVFRFHIHTSADDDRCVNFDRQRNEIKSYDKSPDNLLGIENEEVIYKWKFKLEAGFQSSPNFTHLHQLKSVGGAFSSMPMYTLTTRKGNPDQLELRYAETDNQVTLLKKDLAPFVNNWLEVTEKITYSTSGSYEIEIKRVDNGTTLFAYSNASINNWRPNGSFVRPKWGIYRSLLNSQDLRDEQVLFANFSIEEVNTVSSKKVNGRKTNLISFSNPSFNSVYIQDPLMEINSIKLSTLKGETQFIQSYTPHKELNIDVRLIPKGIYIINFLGEQLNHSDLLLINKP